MEQNIKWETGNLRKEIDGYAPLTKQAHMDPAVRREMLTEALGVLRGPQELSGRTLSRDARGGLIRERVEYTLANGQKTHAVLLMPQAGQAKLPAVLALHDHGGFYYYGKEKLLENEDEPPALTAFKVQYYGGRGWAEALAREGYAVLINDAFYFGERRLRPETLDPECAARYFPPLPGLDEGDSDALDAYHHACVLYEREMAKHILISPITWPGILVSDDMRAVDYLLSRPEVDSARVGCCGLSIGGFRSALLAGLDKRIRCAVVAGWMNTFGNLRHRLLRDHTFMLYVPGLLKRFDLPDITGLFAPGALLVQQCMRDDLFTLEGMAEAESALQAHYGQGDAQAAKQLKIAHYDSPHAFDVRMQEDAFDWLRQHLG